MSARSFLQRLCSPQGALALIALGCFCYSFSGVKPWHTRAFEAFSEDSAVPLRDFTRAGLWIGLTLSGILSLTLLALSRWWAGPEAAPVRRFSLAGGGVRRRWFFGALAALLVFAGVQRWPAMGNSFWGDEGWAFCDYVHGKWRPVDKAAGLQGKIRFKRVTWEQTFFGDQSANNHWLATVLQRLSLEAWRKAGGREAYEFREEIVRLPPLLAGLGSLAALALFLRRVGAPRAGLIAAAFLALHPWHVRFSVEARGYSLMLLFLILSLWALVNALERGRKRDWVIFGLAQFLTLYSWKGALYPLAFVNLVVGARLIFGPAPPGCARTVAVSRWVMANLLGAMLFFPLACPSQLEVSRAIEQVRHRAKPMDAVWAENAVSETLVGMPWREWEKENPREISLGRLASQTPLWTGAAVALLALYPIGARRLWGRDRMLAALCVAILVSGPVAALHFKYALRVELLPWYLLFNLPVLAVLFTSALSPGRRSRGMLWQTPCLAGLAGFAVFARPMTRDLQSHPREDLKGAAALTRGAHEKTGHREASRIRTVWMWRHTFAYEPRGELHVRTAAHLREQMEAARAARGECYVIVGNRGFCNATSPDLMELVKNPTVFDHMTTLWGVERLNTLDIYRMRKADAGVTAATAP